jgi:hypothetical protein
MQKNFRMSLIAGLAIAIDVMMIPGANIAPAAFAGGHNHHHHHHNSVKIHQSISQLNACDHSSCSNSGSNSASVDLPHHSSNNVRISQSIDQANLCSNSDCSNSASNDASVH